MMRWVTITEASKELGVAYSKISRMSRKGKIKTELNPLDDRVKLVDIDEIRAIFEHSNQLLGKSSNNGYSTEKEGGTDGTGTC